MFSTIVFIVALALGLFIGAGGMYLMYRNNVLKIQQLEKTLLELKK